jgi:hypothetical protein
MQALLDAIKYNLANLPEKNKRLIRHKELKIKSLC